MSIWDKQEDDRWEGFACSCNEEGKRDIAEMRAEVAGFLGNPPDSDFLSRVVYELEHGFGGAITGMFADMWAVVNAEKRDWLAQDPNESVTFTVWAQCDSLEDGVAMVMQAFMKRYPKEEQ